MKDKGCQFDLMQVSIPDIANLLSTCEKPAGADMFSKLLRVASCYISIPICHISNSTTIRSLFLSKGWNQAKVPLPKDKK